MKEYCEGALEFLRHAYDEEGARFSYSTRIRDGALVNDFAHRQTLRYTINTYLGLHEAARHGGPIGWLGDVDERVYAFLAQHYDALDSYADHGLLLVLLASVAPGHPSVDRSLARIADAVARPDAPRRFDMQDLSWMLWGALATKPNARAEVVAHRIFELMGRCFVHPESRLPRHRTQRYRANIVSFGSLVYFLRATHEYAERFGDEAAHDLFTRVVRRVIAIQGPDGDWPWMIDVRTGIPFDLYPVFTVHQDSMAMLFLFPAARAGVPGAEKAVERSFRWNLGQNELDTSLVRIDPCFFVYRSIERDAGQPRVRRYLRSLGSAPRRPPGRSARVRVNPECRSYHLGWVLYTWSGRPAVPRLALAAAERLATPGG